MIDLDLIISYRNKLISNKTNSEQRIENLLIESKIKYEFQYPITIEDHFYIVDFYLPNYNIYIEIDGKQHDLKLYKEKDKRRKSEINKYYNLKEIRIKNKMVVKLNLTNFLIILFKKKKHKNKCKKNNILNKYKLSKKDQQLQIKYNKLKTLN
jgi:very-short-patch-repair endonuclease